MDGGMIKDDVYNFDDTEVESNKHFIQYLSNLARFMFITSIFHKLVILGTLVKVSNLYVK